MEWEFKMPPWDFTEVEQNSSEANNLSSVDLKLGPLLQSRGFEMPMEMSVAVDGGRRLKRPRVSSGGGGGVSCLVDGCRNDLSHCREYHRRHKVCELHSKTPVALVAGQEQRFCQQCSRFHLLVEFDEVKRSCRKRLDGHNRRRRKPQPDSISGRLFSNHHGTRFPTYSQIFPIAATDSIWSTMIKSEENALNNHQPSPSHFITDAAEPPPPPHHLGNSFTWSFKEGKQLPFLHDDEMALRSRTAATTIQPLLKTISPAAESSSRKIIFTNELPWQLHSDCALSLLSSSTHNTHTHSSISLGHEMQLDRIPTGGQSMLYSHSQAIPNSENEHDVIEADLHCQRIFHVDGEGTADRASQSLPFSWY